MHQLEALYLSAIAIGMCLVYVGAYFMLQIMYKKKIVSLRAPSYVSILVTVFLITCIYILSYYIIPSRDIGNRFLHAFGGGFMVLFVCLLAAKDTGWPAPKAILFVGAGLLVMILGLFNEVIEFILQEYTHFPFAPNLSDTLLDLMSNMIGFLIGSLCLIPKRTNAYLSSRRRSVARQ